MRRHVEARHQVARQYAPERRAQRQHLDGRDARHEAGDELLRLRDRQRVGVVAADFGGNGQQGLHDSVLSVEIQDHQVLVVEARADAYRALEPAVALEAERVV